MERYGGGQWCTHSVSVRRAAVFCTNRTVCNLLCYHTHVHFHFAATIHCVIPTGLDNRWKWPLAVCCCCCCCHWIPIVTCHLALALRSQLSRAYLAAVFPSFSLSCQAHSLFLLLLLSSSEDKDDSACSNLHSKQSGNHSCCSFPGHWTVSSCTI